MTDKDKNMLAALLTQYWQEELKPQGITAMNDGDFEKLRKVYKLSGAIEVVMESFK